MKEKIAKFVQNCLSKQQININNIGLKLLLLTLDSIDTSLWATLNNCE